MRMSTTKQSTLIPFSPNMSPTQASNGSVDDSSKFISFKKKLEKYGIFIPSWMQCFLLICGILVLTGLTIKDFLPLLQEFEDDDLNVAIQTEIVLNESFQSPPVIVKIPHYKMRKDSANSLITISKHLYNNREHECSECQKLASVNWDVWRNLNIWTMISSEELMDWLCVAFIEKILDNFQIGSNYLDQEYSHWNSPLIDAGFTFLTWQMEMDTYFWDPRDWQNLNTTNIYEPSRNFNGTPLLDLLYDEIANSLCRNNFEISVTLSARNLDKNCLDLLKPESMPVIIDNYAVWIPISTSSTKETEIAFGLGHVTQDNSSNMWIPDGEDIFKLDSIVFFTDSSSQYFSILDSTSFFSSTLAATNMAFSWTETTISYSMAMRSREKREKKKDECYKEISPSVCMAKCSKLWIISHCHCIPFTFRIGITTPDLSRPNGYCTHKHYKQCDPKSYQTVINEECSEKCQHPCEYNAYNWHVIRNEMESGDELGFSILSKPRTTGFVEFSWVTKNTPEAFASQIGGIVSLYLGLNGLSVFMLMISCVDFGRRLYRRQKINENWENIRAISLWRMLVMRNIRGKVEENGKPNSAHSHLDDEKFELFKNQLEQIRYQIQKLRQDTNEKFEKLEERLYEKLNKDIESKMTRIEEKYKKIYANMDLQLEGHIEKL